MQPQSLQSHQSLKFPLQTEGDLVETLSLENQRLRAKEGFLNRLLVAMTLLTRHRSLVSGNLPSALRDITRMAALSVEVQRASVWLLDDTRTQLTCACLFDGIESLHGEGAHLQANNYPAYFAEIERGRVVAADDALTDPRTREFAQVYLLPLNITSMLDVPIKKGDRLVGVVCLEHTGPRRNWQPEELQFAAFLSSLVSLAMDAADQIRR
jgi:two-component system sensor histidine kinase/response regulator